MTRVEVYENEPFDVNPKQEEALQDALGGRVKRKGRRKVRIHGVAGHVRLKTGEIWHIRSRKSGAACLLTWLAYADPQLSALRLLDPLPEQTQAGDLAPLVARAFCISTWRAIQTSGLLRAYHRQPVRASVIRGRIDFARLVHSGGDLSRTPCITFLRLPQTPLNRLLAAAVAQIRRDPILRAAASASLPPLATALAEISPHVDNALLKTHLPLSRLEQPFASSYALACLILRSTGFASGATYDGTGFLIDLANLFERAVARAFHDAPYESEAKRALPVLRQSGSARPSRPTTMQIDVYLSDLCGHKVIVDAKYKTKVSTANLQQVITYCVASGARQAALIFPVGHLEDTRTYVLTPDHGAPYQIHLVEFDLAQTSLSGWHEAGRRVVDTLAGKVMSAALPARS